MKAAKSWLLIITGICIGACIGAALVYAKEPQQVSFTTNKMGKCVLSNGMETHVNQCQIISSGMAYIDHRW